MAFPSKAVCDSSKPSILLSTGEIYQADIIIGADGHRSIVRQAIEGVLRLPNRTGKIIYTGLIPFEAMQSNEHLREVLEIRHPLWLGSGYYAMCETLNFSPVLTLQLIRIFILLGSLMFLAYPVVRSVLHMLTCNFLTSFLSRFFQCNEDFWLCTFWQIEDLDEDAPAGWGTSVPTSCLKYGDKLDPR